MQAVAAEMNLSETAFLYRDGDCYRLRWFTPLAEVDLCGHATLAGAHVLWEDDYLAEDQPARFETRSGLLTARRDGELITLDFPATTAEPCDPPGGLLDALGVTAVSVGKSRYDYLVEVASADAVRQCRPDFGALGSLPVRGVMLTAVSDEPQYDFISRFFAPAVGVNEDPVTGSSHCTLAPYWRAKLGRDVMTGCQASRRGGIVHVTVRDDRVVLGGRAVTVLRGELL